MTIDPQVAALFDFIEDASGDMQNRLFEKARDWGTTWRDPSYTDGDVTGRLERAKAHLLVALDRYREGAVGIDEVRKRAADVANQAFMLADPERLR